MKYIYNNKTPLRELLKLNGLKGVKASDGKGRDIVRVIDDKVLLESAKASDVFNFLSCRQIFK